MNNIEEKVSIQIYQWQYLIIMQRLHAKNALKILAPKSATQFLLFRVTFSILVLIQLIYSIENYYKIF